MCVGDIRTPAGTGLAVGAFVPASAGDAPLLASSKLVAASPKERVHVLAVALAALASSKLSASKVGPALKLRGGGVLSLSPAEVQTFVGGLVGLASAAGYVYTEDIANKYMFTDPLTPQTKILAKVCCGVNLAAAVLLLKPEFFLVALAGTLYSLADQLGEVLDMPRYPLVAWGFMPFVFEWAMAKGYLPKSAFGAYVMANGIAGITYQAKAKLTQQSKSIAKFSQGSCLAIGAYLVSQAQGNTAAQSFGYWCGLQAAASLKFACVDGQGVVNPVDSYLWAAFYATAASIALTA